MTPANSDALVLFGATGDLAHKMIFPALYAMATRGALKVPVVGVAFPKWSLAFAAIKTALGSVRRPAHYLAIPPSLFETVIKGLGAANLADGARVIVERPFGRDLASARKLNRVARLVFPENAIFRIDHFLGKEAIMNPRPREVSG